ncbi:DUF4139 domain-containing protein [Rhodocyclus tenuis]|uniref:DUF4139 domain-containing protein n=1 Tax=Rhodocyclus tenuis TaxID=1066 RepID=UPI001905ADBA|nr:DUF4139 domain-containing protein [Rhodocyclus tenuis]MBK1681206.1 DUF4139 domain-containing protein [Rhodocyclus tenuis]
MMKRTLGFIAATVFAASAAAGTAEIVSGSADRESTAITVYNDDLALIKERRRITLPAGLSRLSLREVSAQLRPETAMLRAISGRPLTLLEQNFDFDLLTPEKLLEKYVGREVSVLRVHPTTGEERREKATVLAASNGTVLRFADRIETGAPGRIVFDSVPVTLRDRPTLSLLLEAAGGSQSLELSYLSGGLSWQADYVANLAADGKSMDLSAWVTLNNHSGASYEDASLQLVAGKLNRAAPARPLLAYAASALRAKAAEVAEESLLDYHLYSFERPTTIADNQSKQLALLSAAGIPVRRDYVLAGADYYYRERSGQIGQKINPAVFVEFANQGGQLGKPLPAGVIRVYARDSKGAAQFVGEDRIAHTAKNENVRLKLGEAFDISAERKQTSYRKLGETSAESAFHLELRNARDEAVSVRVEEPLPGDWEIVQETQKSTKESARLAVWNVSVPANGAATLDYTARVRW